MQPRHQPDTLAVRAWTVLALLTVTYLDATDRLERRWRQARASSDTGSETVEKAVLVAIMLAAAIGLAAAIRALVNAYQTQITP